ncbi:MAG: hypothetical protein OEY15_09780 [Myxococcales bacterium]|nr:hypothetical protein [Myxococcales bacterium]
MGIEFASYVLAVCVSFGVGIPILLDSRKRDDRPALYLALAVISDGVEWAFWTLSVQTPALGTSLGDAFSIGSRVWITIAAIFFGVFTCAVFRRDSRPASIATALLALAMVVGFIGSGLRGDWPGYRGDNAWIWLENTAQLIVYTWGGIEALRFHAKLRRRLAHGLSDPVITNRVLLWAIYGLTFAVSLVLYQVALGAADQLTDLDGFISGVAAIGKVTLWFAFFPPRRYRDWLRVGAAPTRP